MNKVASRPSRITPRYPVFIPTKGRWDTRWTIRGFENIGLDFRAVIEPQEFDSYARVVDPSKLLILPFSGRGLCATRNWIWDYAQSLGVKRFWTFDDNIGTSLRYFGVVSLFRLNDNLKVPVLSAVPLRIIEDFVERFDNVPIAGMNYFMFASRKTVIPPFYLNTRVYSNMLIETDCKNPETGRPFRNECFYNDDTDLCLRVLKAGYCTVLLNSFLIFKLTTMTVSGGMTPHYEKESDATESELEKDGRYRMAKELADKHPDVTKITRKWGRWQHHVDYSGFRRNRLVYRSGLQLESGPDEFQMELHRFPRGYGYPSLRIK